MISDKQARRNPEWTTAASSEITAGSSLVTGHSPLFFASSNPGKLREFREAAAARGLRVEPLPGFAGVPPCVEDGQTFEENARKKAAYYSRVAPGWVLADDSGICVDLLDGAPGIYSARFAGPQATDDENNRRLLAKIHQAERRDHSAPRPSRELLRSAHYVCAIALAESGQVSTVVQGRADGIIVDQPKGTGGFGYDPHFFYPPLGKTFAEISADEKFGVSHRGRAFRKLLDHLGASDQ